jgi:hypothetical protein
MMRWKNLALALALAAIPTVAWAGNLLSQSHCPIPCPLCP